jgi:hypothetical protein
VKRRAGWRRQAARGWRGGVGEKDAELEQERWEAN